MKGQFGYDQWVDLTAKRPKLDKETGKEADPGASLMDMMKDLYDNVRASRAARMLGVLAVPPPAVAAAMRGYLASYRSWLAGASVVRGW